MFTDDGSVGRYSAMSLRALPHDHHVLGLILALISALATSLSFLFKQRGAVRAEPIHVGHLLGLRQDRHSLS